MWVRAVVLRCLPCALAAGIAPAPAGAALSVDSFAFTPSSPQAGGSPDLTLDVALTSSPATADVRDLALTLAPGLLANPTAAPPCTAAQLASFGGCPATSRVGTGTVTARMPPPFPPSVAAPAELFLVEPLPGEAAHLALVVTTPVGKLTAAAPVTASAAGSFEIAFKDLPRSARGLDIAIERVQLTINGRTPGGEAFTRNPTSCGSAVTRLTAVEYDPPASPQTAEQAFSPTSCEALAFAPRLTALALPDAAGDGVALTTATTQGPGGAATQRAQQTLPPALTPRATAFGRACSALDPSLCPSESTVGSVLAAVPFAAKPLEGRVVLYQAGGVLPGLTILFGEPFPIRLDGTLDAGAGGVAASFDSIPDIPVSRLEVRLHGGPDSLLVAGSGLCDRGPAVGGEFAGHNGSSARASAPICRAARPRGKLRLGGVAAGRPRLSLRVVARPAGAPRLTRVDVSLPRGLSLDRRRLDRGLVVKADGKRFRRAGKVTRRGLRILVSGNGATVLSLTLGGPALRISNQLEGRIREGRERRLRVRVRVPDIGGRPKTLRLAARPR